MGGSALSVACMNERSLSFLDSCSSRSLRSSPRVRRSFFAVYLCVLTGFLRSVLAYIHVRRVLHHSFGNARIVCTHILCSHSSRVFGCSVAAASFCLYSSSHWSCVTVAHLNTLRNNKQLQLHSVSDRGRKCTVPS